MITPHRDYGPSMLRSHRYHLALVTNDQVEFAIGGQIQHLAPGEIWEINNRKLHAVRNLGAEGRVHLILDYVVPGEVVLDPSRRRHRLTGSIRPASRPRRRARPVREPLPGVARASARAPCCAAAAAGRGAARRATAASPTNSPLASCRYAIDQSGKAALLDHPVIAVDMFEWRRSLFSRSTRPSTAASLPSMICMKLEPLKISTPVIPSSGLLIRADARTASTSFRTNAGPRPARVGKCLDLHARNLAATYADASIPAPARLSRTRTPPSWPWAWARWRHIRRG